MRPTTAHACARARGLGSGPAQRRGVLGGCPADVEPAFTRAPSAVRLVARIPSRRALVKPHPPNSALIGIAACNRRRLFGRSLISSGTPDSVVCPQLERSTVPRMQPSAALAEFAVDALPTHRPHGVCLTFVGTTKKRCRASCYALPLAPSTGMALARRVRTRLSKLPHAHAHRGLTVWVPARQGWRERYALTSVLRARHRAVQGLVACCASVTMLL